MSKQQMHLKGFVPVFEVTSVRKAIIPIQLNWIIDGDKFESAWRDWPMRRFRPADLAPFDNAYPPPK